MCRSHLSPAGPFSFPFWPVYSQSFTVTNPFLSLCCSCTHSPHSLFPRAHAFATSRRYPRSWIPFPPPKVLLEPRSHQQGQGQGHGLVDETRQDTRPAAYSSTQQHPRFSASLSQRRYLLLGKHPFSQALSVLCLLPITFTCPCRPSLSFRPSLLQIQIV